MLMRHPWAWQRERERKKKKHEAAIRESVLRCFRASSNWVIRVWAGRDGMAGKVGNEVTLFTILPWRRNTRTQTPHHRSWLLTTRRLEIFVK